MKFLTLLTIYIFAKDQQTANITLPTETVHNYIEGNIDHKTADTGKTILLAINNEIYTVDADNNKSLFYTHNADIISIYSDKQFLYISDIHGKIIRVSIANTGKKHTLDLSRPAQSFLKEQDKLICIHVDGSLSCLYTTNSVFTLLWTQPSTLHYGAHIHSVLVHKDTIIHAHTSNHISVIDINSGVIYKQIIVPFKSLMHLHVLANSPDILYCITDKGLTVIDLKTYEHIMHKEMDFLDSTQSKNLILAATHDLIYRIDTNTNKIIPYYNIPQADELLSMISSNYISSIKACNNRLFINTRLGSVILNLDKHDITMNESHIHAVIPRTNSYYIWWYNVTLGPVGHIKQYKM